MTINEKKVYDLISLGGKKSYKEIVVFVMGKIDNTNPAVLAIQLIDSLKKQYKIRQVGEFYTVN